MNSTITLQFLRVFVNRHLLMLIAIAVLALTFRPASANPASESLYDRLGGLYPIAATVDDLVERLYVNGALNANPVVAKIHANKVSRHGFKVLVTNWVVQATGGPKIYHARPLDKAHAHLGLTNREFDVVLNECATTFYKFNVPAKEMDELMALLESFRGQVVTKR